MKLALECSDELLDMVQPFADFDWILAARYRESETYAAHYRESKNVKFVDNSVTDLGAPVNLDALLEVMENCKGDYVISPDWINDHKQIIDAYEECVERFGARRTVGVLQGSSPKEALDCLDTYKEGLLAVPYRVGGSEKGDPDWLKSLRRELVVAHIPNDRTVHLLGFNTLDELLWYSGRPNVLSIDTDVPIRAGLVLEDIDDFDRTTDVTRETLSEKNWAGICRNIALLRKWMP